MTALMALSPLDGRYCKITSSLRPIFSEYALIKQRLNIEIRWLIFLANDVSPAAMPKITDEGLDFLENIIDQFTESDAEQVKEIEATTNHDLKAVEYFIKTRCKDQNELKALVEFIHFGLTSEDVNNLAYASMLSLARSQIITPILENILTQLRDLAHDHAAIAMLARTHGQVATPTTVGKEFANVASRLLRQLDALDHIPMFGKLNGATGNFSAFHAAYPELDWLEISKNFVWGLGLDWNIFTTQIEPHDYIAELSMCMMRINTILLDLNRDAWSYISINYLSQKNIKTEVGSSTMPHKVNPIDFENAEGNLGLANALFGFFAEKLPISRWQRDLSDSTVLRNLGSAFGYALLAYESTLKGLGKVTPNTQRIAEDLSQHWEVLAEPIQTVMRKHGICQPYEKLKDFTRGAVITKELLHSFIQALALPDDEKQHLLALTPENYLGYAKELAQKI